MQKLTTTGKPHDQTKEDALASPPRPLTTTYHDVSRCYFTSPHIAAKMRKIAARLTDNHWCTIGLDRTVRIDALRRSLPCMPGAIRGQHARKAIKATGLYGLSSSKI